MSDDNDQSDKPVPKIAISMDAIASAIFTRAEKYGIASLLLFGLLYWAKPHVDEMIKSHGKLIEKTVEVQATQATVQARQAETLETATKTLERVDRITVDTNTIVHELKASKHNGGAAGGTQ